MTTAQVLIQNLLAHPEQWEHGEFTVDNPSLGVRLWAGSGSTFLDTYPNKGHLGLFDRWRVWRAIKKSYALQLKDKPTSQTLMVLRSRARNALIDRLNVLIVRAEATDSDLRRVVALLAEAARDLAEDKS